MTFTEKLILKEARTWLGTPYHHQAACKGVGCDCLGLVRGIWLEVYGQLPEQIPNYTPDWAELKGEETLYQAASKYCQETDSSALSVGKLVLFRWSLEAPAKHCGIMSKPDRFIHAYERTGVIEARLSDAWRQRLAYSFTFPTLSKGASRTP